MNAGRRRVAVTLLLTGVTGVATVGSTTAVAERTAAANAGRSGEAGLQAVRAWTDRYHDESAALADGFVATDQCVPSMGHHYVHPARMDTRLEPSRPEALLYAPGPDGGRVLVGAEWIVFDADQNLATDDDRPALFGHPFDGPMPGHGPGMPVHYDLHAWAWLDNPDGGFATWNNAVIC